MKASGKRYVVRTKFFDAEGNGGPVYCYLTPEGRWSEDLANAKRYRTQMEASRARTKFSNDAGIIVKINDAVTDDIVSKING